MLIHKEMHNIYVYDSVSFEKCIYLCNQPPCQDVEHSVTREFSLYPLLEGHRHYSISTVSVTFPKLPVGEAIQVDSSGSPTSSCMSGVHFLQFLRRILWHKYIEICYLFFASGTFKLFPCFGYYGSNYGEHSYACLLVGIAFIPFR